MCSVMPTNGRLQHRLLWMVGFCLFALKHLVGAIPAFVSHKQETQRGSLQISMVSSKRQQNFGRMTPYDVPPRKAVSLMKKKKQFTSLQEMMETLGDSTTNQATAQKHYSRENLDAMPCLVLNADYQPLSTAPLSLWSWQDAVKAVFLDKVVPLHTYDVVISSASMEFAVPSVIVLKEYAKLPNAGQVEFSRKNLYIRDDYQCQYCRNHFLPIELSYDHVIPRSHGGKTEWENIVTSCRSCNLKKGSLPLRKLKSVGMELKKMPHRPTFFEIQDKAKQYPTKNMHDSWNPYVNPQF
mmetsp:Transcript_35949/g.59097  ORF Transcript_35949/g.59097 Transcript_35949/m.59097 type:complete len:296 (+) Transcript_35949:102-989(+)